MNEWGNFLFQWTVFLGHLMVIFALCEFCLNVSEREATPRSSPSLLKISITTLMLKKMQKGVSPPSPHRLSLHWDVKKSYLPTYWRILMISIKEKQISLLCSHQNILHRLKMEKLVKCIWSVPCFHHLDRTETLGRWRVVPEVCVLCMTVSFLPLDHSKGSKKKKRCSGQNMIVSKSWDNTTDLRQSSVGVEQCKQR